MSACPRHDFIVTARTTRYQLEAEMQPADGFRVAIRGSAGPWVVFVSTFAELNFVYAPLVERLARTHRTLLYAPQVSATKTFGPAARAGELVRVLSTLGIDTPVHLVSWSDAGMGALVFSDSCPDRVMSRTFIGMPDRYLLPLALRWPARLVATRSLDRLTPAGMSSFLIALLMGGTKMPTRSLTSEVRALGPVSGYLKHSILPCLLDEPGGRPGPATLVLGGDRDRFVKLEQMRALAHRLAATFLAVPGGDHFLPWTSAEVVTASVTRFIATGDAVSGE